MELLFPYENIYFIESDILMKNIFKNKIFKRICLILFIIYISIIFINQQKTLASYNSQKEYYNTMIAEAKNNNKLLKDEKSNLTSNDYIEKIAREKLDMYSENERVYININK